MTQGAVADVAARLRRLATEAGEARAAELWARRAAQLVDLERRLTRLEQAAERLSSATPTSPVPLVKAVPSVDSDAPPTGPEGDVPPFPRPAATLLGDGGIVALCLQEGLEVIDRREVPGGSLWVVGPEHVARPLLRQLSREGIPFTFSPAGSRATNGRPGWFTKSPR